MEFRKFVRGNIPAAADSAVFLIRAAGLVYGSVLGAKIGLYAADALGFGTTATYAASAWLALNGALTAAVVLPGVPYYGEVFPAAGRIDYGEKKDNSQLVFDFMKQ